MIKYFVFLVKLDFGFYKFRVYLKDLKVLFLVWGILKLK